MIILPLLTWLFIYWKRDDIELFWESKDTLDLSRSTPFKYLVKWKALISVYNLANRDPGYLNCLTGVFVQLKKFLISISIVILRDSKWTSI